MRDGCREGSEIEVAWLRHEVDERPGRFERRARPRVSFSDMTQLWAAVHPGFELAHVDADSALAVIYTDAAAHLPLCDFTLVHGSIPHISARRARRDAPPYQVTWAPAASLAIDDDIHAGVILNLLARAAAAEMYTPGCGELEWANVNLPPPDGPPEAAGMLTTNQRASLARQLEALEDNWAHLEQIEDEERREGVFGEGLHAYLAARIQFAATTALTQNDGTLAELLYYLQAKRLAGTRTYGFARRMLREANARRRGSH